MKALVWDTFKAVIRGIFISQKAYLNKKRQNSIGGLLNDITTFEAKYKATGSGSLKQELNIKISKLHLMEASLAAKSMLYAKQHLFEYREKPNKQLARILAQHTSMQPLSDCMVTSNGDEVISIPDKLKGFVEDPNPLYDTTNPFVSDKSILLEIN